MKKHHRRFEEVLRDALKNPEFRQEWETSEAQYRLIETLISERLKRDLSQRELAKKAGIKQPSLARIESGSVMPSLQVLAKLAKALGTKLQISFEANGEISYV
jgi:ribosome-binding protein aMBF1 (putative translation factor)